MAQDALNRAKAEIVRFHAALENWYQGTSDRADLDRTITDGLHPDFTLIMPAGKVYSRADIVALLTSAHGSNPRFRIEIEECWLVGSWDRVIAAHYVERQTGALNSDPENRRRSTVLFEATNTLRWLHLQETGMPQS